MTTLFLTAPLLPLASAGAQWSDDPSVNTLVSGSLSGCVITHTAAASDGGTWIGWYDASSGYDIMVQKLDAGGLPVFAQPAIVVDQSLSWVQDFDLAAAGNGCAVAWADGTTTGVALIGSDGLVTWQHDLHDGSGYQAGAQVCETNDGFIVAGWMDENVSKLQRIGADGTLVWDEPVTIGGSGFFSMSDVQPASDHDVIASMVCYMTFNGAKTLRAQRVRADGSLAWSEPAIDVFTQGSLQYGSYPEFISDGAGGGIFTWYSTSNLQALVQWIDGEGQKRFAANGQQVSVSSGMLHVGPTACLDPDTDEVTVFCTRTNGNQSQHGVQVNRFDAAGTALWGAGGTQVAPLGSNGAPHDLQARQLDSLACAAWLQLAPAGSGTVLAAAMNPAGEPAWDENPVPIGEPDIDRSDLSVTSGDMLIAAWSDDRDGSDRIHAQNVRPDGQLGEGGCPADINGDTTVNVDDLLVLISVWGTDDAAADIDGDGEVATEDLLAVLAAWGACT